MATYNGANYVLDQLHSFLDQTRKPDELVITDDCSSDETEFIVQKFSETAPFTVRFFRNPVNLGYSGNFDAALKRVSGDVVFLCDQDDVWFPEKIEHMCRLVELYPEALLLMNDATLTDGRLNEVGLTKLGQIRSAGMPDEKFVMGCCCAVRKELLDICLPIPDAIAAHDDWLAWFADGLQAKIVDETPLQFYRRHESNESQFIANRTTKITRRLVFTHVIKEIFSGKGSEKDLRRLTQLSLFRDGIKRSLERATVRRRLALANLLDRVEIRIAILSMRAKVREKRLLPRIFSVFRIFLGGGYVNANGLRSMLRDLVG